MRFTISVIVIVLITSLCVISFNMENVNADEVISSNAIQIYQKNREISTKQYEEKINEFNNKKLYFKNEIQQIQNDIDKIKREKAQINNEVLENKNKIVKAKELQGKTTYVLFPLISNETIMSFFINKDKIYNFKIFLICITIINVFIFIYRKQYTHVKKYKKFIIAVFIILIVFISIPAFAQDQTIHDRVIENLKEAELLLTQSEHEKFIKILEEKPSKIIYVPSLQSGDPLLSVMPEVAFETPEYLFTLAALYTHEGKKGKAIDAIMQLEKVANLLNRENHQKIAINSIKFLIQEQQTQHASNLINTLPLNNVLDVREMLNLAKYLKNNSMQPSANKISGIAIDNAKGVSEFISLHNFFVENNEHAKSDEALNKAIEYIINIEDVFMLMEIALSENKNNILEDIVKVINTHKFNYHDKVKLIDLFLKNNRNEEAIAIFNKMITEDVSRTKNNIEKLLFLTEAALERNLLAQAANAIEYLVFLIGRDNSHKFYTKFGTEIPAARDLPDKNTISLLNHLGLIKEEMGIYDKTEEIYIHSVIESLSTILNSYGYKLPENINDFFLLGRIWIGWDRENYIGQLDRVYGILEKQAYEKQISNNLGVLEQLEDTKKELESAKNQLDMNLQDIKKESFYTSIKLLFHYISTILTILFIIFCLIGCAIIAYKYCEKMTIGKTFALFTKYAENLGWLQIMSILGAIPGILFVLFGQFFQIFHNIQEKLNVKDGAN